MRQCSAKWIDDRTGEEVACTETPRGTRSLCPVHEGQRNRGHPFGPRSRKKQGSGPQQCRATWDGSDGTAVRCDELVEHGTLCPVHQGQKASGKPFGPRKYRKRGTAGSLSNRGSLRGRTVLPTRPAAQETLEDALQVLQPHLDLTGIPGCHLLTVDWPTEPGGYPRRVDVDGRMKAVHRYLVELREGRELARDEQVMHSCSDAAHMAGTCVHDSAIDCPYRCCVNIDHLGIGDQISNQFASPLTVAGRNSRKTHCIHGHPFDGANTIHVVNPNGRPGRKCRACKDASRRRSAARTAAEVARRSTPRSTPLTDDDIREIRERCAAGERQVDVGIDFGIAQVTVSSIVRRYTYKHVT